MKVGFANNYGSLLSRLEKDKSNEGKDEADMSFVLV